MPTARALNAPEYDTGNLLDGLMILLGAALLYTSNSLKILVFIRSFNNLISRHCMAAVQVGLGWAVSRGCKYRAGLGWAGLAAARLLRLMKRYFRAAPGGEVETHRTKGDIIYLEPVICWVSAGRR